MVDEAVTRWLAREDCVGRVLVGLSGGADSVALLAALTRAGANCVAVHCNYHLRGAESDRDQAHAEAVAARLGVEMRVEHFSPDSRLPGESLEMACRRLRYDLFDRLMAELGTDCVAVGHHADDNLETMLLNVMRSAGLRGVKGMVPRTGRVARPLLGVTRAAIEAYVTSLGLTWVTDSSNLTDDFARNRIRHAVIEPLRAIPGAIEASARCMKHLRDDYRFYRQCIDEKLALYAVGTGIDVAALAAAEPSARLLMVKWLDARGLPGAMADDVLAAVARGESGKRFGGYMLDRGRLYRPEAVAAEWTLTETIIDRAAYERERREGADRFTAWLDAAVLSHGAGWTVRSWRQGDRIAPLGMAGTKKVSDVMRDAHIAEADKPGIPIVERDGVIVWVGGLRNSRRWMVTDATARIVRLRLSMR